MRAGLCLGLHAARHGADRAWPLLFDPDIQLASLDHALWFHRPFRADDWLLYAQDSPSADGARGFCRGSIFTRDGLLVASVAQEGLMRQRAAPIRAQIMSKRTDCLIIGNSRRARFQAPKFAHHFL